MFMYTIKPGDTLYQIATKYNTTVKRIMDLNYLKDTNLKVGEVIRIPETYTKEEDMYLPNYINYVVKKGDTLYGIAKSNNISVDTLIKDNAITNNMVYPGQNLKIRIPNKSTIEIEECYGEDYTPPNDTTPVLTTYTVEKGDSLYQIAKKFGTTTDAIINLNNLKNNILTIGQKLKIPESNQNNNKITYTVEKGDSLYQIAKKFNTTVDSIIKKNNLKNNNLNIGQKLII